MLNAHHNQAGGDFASASALLERCISGALRADNSLARARILTTQMPQALKEIRTVHYGRPVRSIWASCH